MAGLASFAILLTASRALRGNTDAGQGVLVSPREALAIKSPQIAVFAVAGSMTPQGRDIANAKGKVNLRFELYVPWEVKITDGSTVLDMTSSSSGELVLSAMWCDCVRTLSVGTGIWAQLWRQFVFDISDVKTSTQLFEDKDGGRISMRVVEMFCEPLSEPIAGRQGTGAWSNLLTQLTADGVADPDSAALAVYFRHKVEANVAGVWQCLAAGTGVGVEHLGETGDGNLDWLDRTGAQL